MRWLDGLAGRFSLLLAATLLVANGAAFAVLTFDRVRLDRAALVEREVERVVSLLPAVEAAAEARRSRVARAASTRFSRVSVDREPTVADVPSAPRSAALTRTLSAFFEGRDVRAAILVSDRGRWGARETVAVSVALGDGAGWLNVVSRGERRPPGPEADVFLLVLGASLAAVLAVGLLFVRRLTRPLSDLAAAARASGRGDRSVRLEETGPREFRETATAFNEMQARIAGFDAERMRTLAAVGHDLRTPITSLRIRLELLDEGDVAPMIQTLDEMTVMADGLVAYARGTGEAEARTEVDLGAALARLAEERGANLRFVTDATVRVRPVALSRAIGNLIDNAKRYGGGAEIALTKEGLSAIITIEDEGPGIPEDALSTVFEPFVRGEESRNAETGGAGLGLSIARTIVTASGGTLTLANRAEGGLRATVTLPVAG
ncbi:MAG: ATP-binding protein [Pseudomonadota bacterium]